MSYCRWSCLNFRSDVYVYADVSGGWTTHVAGARYPEGAPKSGATALLEFLRDNPKDAEGMIRVYREGNTARREWLDKNPAVPIDHPDAGKSFNHATPGECADNLDRLAAEGFVVPEYAIEELRKEAEDGE